MKSSRRAHRMQRHLRARRGVNLNLVSLMDIFTILVFFLLVSQAEIEVRPNTQGVELPESVVRQELRRSPTLTVTASEILAGGHPVLTVSDVLASKQLILPELRDALRRLAAAMNVKLQDQERGPEEMAEITILGDREIPYQVLRKILATATDAGYDTLALAVEHNPKAGGG